MGFELVIFIFKIDKMGRELTDAYSKLAATHAELVDARYELNTLKCNSMGAGVSSVSDNSGNAAHQLEAELHRSEEQQQEHRLNSGLMQERNGQQDEVAVIAVVDRVRGPRLAGGEEVMDCEAEEQREDGRGGTSAGHEGIWLPSLEMFFLHLC